MRLALALLLSTALLIPTSSLQAEEIRPQPAADERANFCFAPLGKYDKGLLETARQGAAYLYGAETTILPRRALPKMAYYKPRKRYRAEKLLDYLQAEVVPDSGCDIVIGFTAVDISTTKDTHKDWGILGLGEVAGTVGVVSSFRMKRRANRRKQKRRAVSVTNHEIGHVLGAPHGGEPGCLMNDAQGTIATVDKEHGLICEDSRALIEAHTGRSLPVIDQFDWSEVLR
jgi:archaemetzincin